LRVAFCNNFLLHVRRGFGRNILWAVTVARKVDVVDVIPEIVGTLLDGVAKVARVVVVFFNHNYPFDTWLKNGVVKEAENGIQVCSTTAERNMQEKRGVG
jgi:hypothetical protein